MLKNGIKYLYFIREFKLGMRHFIRDISYAMIFKNSTLKSMIFNDKIRRNRWMLNKA